MYVAKRGKTFKEFVGGESMLAEVFYVLRVV
jgi:hypothetical protein